MTNEQVTAARAVLNDFPALKVTIGRIEAGEVLIPYLASDPFVRGDEVLVTGVSPDVIRARFRDACNTMVSG